MQTLSAYAGIRAQLYETAKRRGKPLVLTKTTRVLTDEVAETSVDTVSIVSGYFMQASGDPKEYARMSLTRANPITGVFVTIDETEPPLGAVGTFGGVSRTVRAATQNSAPDGTATSWLIIMGV